MVINIIERNYIMVENNFIVYYDVRLKMFGVSGRFGDGDDLFADQGVHDGGFADVENAATTDGQ